MNKASQILAVDNLASGIYVTARIPERVFIPDYTEPFVMDFRRLIAKDTIKLFKILMAFEEAQSVAVACFQQSKVAMPERQGQDNDWRDDVFFVSSGTEEEAYWSFLRRNWAEYGQTKATLEMRPPWFVFAEIIGACSDVARWYIYGEKFSDVALLGFKGHPGLLLEKKLRSEFGIVRLVDALDSGRLFNDPENEYSVRQRTKLRSVYLK